MGDTNFPSGMVRGDDVNHLDYTSLPLVGLIGVARTAAEGAAKYGRLNYMRGCSCHDLLNHSIGHIVQFLLGDRTQPHLEHAAWGLLAAIQSHTLDPELSSAHLLGPGATLSAANLEHIESQAATLKTRREAGEFDDSGSWSLRDAPEVERLLDQRYETRFDAARDDDDDDDDDGDISHVGEDDIEYEDDRLLPTQEIVAGKPTGLRPRYTNKPGGGIKWLP